MLLFFLCRLPLGAELLRVADVSLGKSRDRVGLPAAEPRQNVGKRAFLFGKRLFRALQQRACGCLALPRMRASFFRRRPAFLCGAQALVQLPCGGYAEAAQQRTPAKIRSSTPAAAAPPAAA